MVHDNQEMTDSTSDTYSQSSSSYSEGSTSDTQSESTSYSEHSHSSLLPGSHSETSSNDSTMSDKEKSKLKKFQNKKSGKDRESNIDTSSSDSATSGSLRGGQEPGLKEKSVLKILRPTITSLEKISQKELDKTIELIDKFLGKIVNNESAHTLRVLLENSNKILKDTKEYINGLTADSSYTSSTSPAAGLYEITGKVIDLFNIKFEIKWVYDGFKKKLNKSIGKIDKDLRSPIRRVLSWSSTEDLADAKERLERIKEHLETQRDDCLKKIDAAITAVNKANL